jgi:DNA-binding FrmR family transcriptional regulator
MKCCKKQVKNKKCACRESLNHLSRIEGQIRTLKKYIEEEKRCEDVAILTTSIAKSFDTLRAKTLKSFFINEILSNKELSKKDLLRIEEIFKLYKK